ncbi:hypothetical protein JRI60_23335 [Archangium violaceum]|uniref:hypothetical protein n=1 Tax=Archangium violaceum TaxID=83451 RepID=UPI0019500019|nr:hypothetical protein [Archangium violaceum]QRO01747.1 hypothetical protein JRI60_23335 [Archangium violaceum]
MTTPIQAFAFDFSWPLQGQDQPLANQILITDKPNAADTVTVLVQCLANPGVTIILEPQTNPVASASNHHFELYFDPNAIAGASGIKVSDTAQWSFACVQHPTDASDSKAGVSLYLLSKSTLRINPQSPLALNVTNIGATSRGGERSSVATFTWSKSSSVVKFENSSSPIFIPGQDNPYQLTEQRTFDIVSPPSNAAASPLPLYASFSTPNVVANDGTSKNLLVVRLVNTSQDAITLSPSGSDSPTQLVLFFDTSSSNNDRWALSADSHVHAFYLPGKEDGSGINTSWSGHGSWQVSGPDDSNRWTLTPMAGKTRLAPGESLEIPISNIVTEYATGQTTLHLRYEDFPDHPDGEAQLPIQKLPMFYQNNVLYRVGVNTTAPEEQLHVANGGNLRVDGQYKSWGPIDFQPNTDKTPANEDLLRLRDMNGNVVMTGTSNGKLGLGTTSPSETLEVHTGSGSYGITHTDGTVKVSSYLNSAGGWLGTQSNHNLSLFTNNGPAQVVLNTAGNLSINSGNLSINSGSLGIGTTSPADKLEVHTGSGSYGITHTDGTVKVSSYVSGAGGWLGTRSNHNLSFFTNGGHAQVVLNTAGNVGIGTTGPAERLHITGGDLRVDGAIKSYGPINLYPNVDKTPANEDLLRIQDMSGSRVLTVRSDGKVGIGTMDPAAALDVVGGIRLNGQQFMRCENYSGSGRTHYQTSYSTADWVPVLAGFSLPTHKDDSHGQETYFYQSGGRWYIYINTVYHDAGGWTLQVLFIRSQLVSGTWTATS